jgi:hypothetical protein
METSSFAVQGKANGNREQELGQNGGLCREHRAWSIGHGGMRRRIGDTETRRKRLKAQGKMEENGRQTTAAN